ncbi:hypothetical protein Tco_1189462, partial [Tanacetum coccineum]
ETPKILMQAWDKFFEIKHAQSEEVQEWLNKLLQDLQSINEELAEYINTPNWNLPTSSYDDDSIDFLLEEFADELTLLKPSSSGINKANYDPEEEIRCVERLLYDNSSSRPSKELNEIDLFLTSDESIPPGIDSDYSDSEGDNLFLERLLHDDSTPLLDIPSLTHVTFPFEDHHDLDFTCVVRVFYPSSPIWIARIFEASRARGFCPSITRASHPQLHFGNPISKSYRLTLSFGILNKWP